MSGLESDLEISRIRLNLSHLNCKSKFGLMNHENVGASLVTSIPVDSKRFCFTVETLHPILSRKDAYDVLRTMKKNSSMNSVQSWSLQNHTMYVSFVEDPVDSPLALMQPLGIFDYNEKSSNGVDDITVTINASDINNMKNILGLLGKVHILSKYYIWDNINVINPILSEREECVFKLAVSSGYFENPKKCYLKDLASKLNISIVATEKYLRAAEQKIFMSYGSSYASH